MKRITKIATIALVFLIGGISGVYASTGFDDVPEEHTHAAGVRWAVSHGIVKGRSPDKFDPDTPVTRGEMVTILHRYNDKFGPVQYTEADLHWPGNLVLRVGVDIQPGTYSVTYHYGGCYWARLSGFGGDAKDIIAEGHPPGLAGRFVIEIKETDVGIQLRDC